MLIITLNSQGAWALGTCTGPIIGAAFVQNPKSKNAWRWIFYLMFPFCFVGFITIPLVLTLKPRTSSVREKLARVDWFGGFLFISSTTAFLIAICWGGTEEPWGSFRTIVPFVFGILGIIGSLIWEAYWAKEPFLKRSLFYSVSSYAAYFGAMVQGLLVRFLNFTMFAHRANTFLSYTDSCTTYRSISYRSENSRHYEPVSLSSR
jgi:MFS family permease